MFPSQMALESQDWLSEKNAGHSSYQIRERKFLIEIGTDKFPILKWNPQDHPLGRVFSTLKEGPTLNQNICIRYLKIACRCCVILSSLL